MKKEKSKYTAPDVDITDLGTDLILTSRQWDLEEVPLETSDAW